MEMHTVNQLVGGKCGTRIQGSRLQTQGSFNRLALLRLKMNPTFLPRRLSNRKINLEIIRRE